MQLERTKTLSELSKHVIQELDKDDKEPLIQLNCFSPSALFVAVQ